MRRPQITVGVTLNYIFNIILTTRLDIHPVFRSLFGAGAGGLLKDRGVVLITVIDC
jgi:hypothetical protein